MMVYVRCDSAFTDVKFLIQLILSVLLVREMVEIVLYEQLKLYCNTTVVN